LETAAATTMKNLRTTNSYGLEAISLTKLKIMKWRDISLFWDVTQRKLVVTAVSGQPICPVFKGQF